MHVPRGLLVTLDVDPADERLPLGLRRCGAALTHLQTAVLRARLAEDVPFGQALLAGGALPACWHLEELLRLYADIHDRERLEKVRRDVTLLGDVLGAAHAQAELAARASAWALPVPVRERFAVWHAEACGHVRGWAEARAWVERADGHGPRRPRASKIARRLRKLEWPGADADPSALARALSEQLRTAHADIERLDLREPESGLRAVHRRLRGFGIVVSALDGGVQVDTDTDAPAGWERYLSDAVEEGPFRRVSAVPEGVRALRWPAPLFHALEWTIAVLGRIRDRAQRTLAVQSVLRATGDDAPAARWLGDEALSEAEACERAQEIVERVIHADRLLPRCAEALEAQV